MMLQKKSSHGKTGFWAGHCWRSDDAVAVVVILRHFVFGRFVYLQSEIAMCFFREKNENYFFLCFNNFFCYAMLSCM